MANLRPPFEAQSQLNLGLKVKEGKFDRLPLRYSTELMDILECMLKVNPSERYSAEDLLRHKLLKLRGQDYALRLQYSSMKMKHDKLQEENRKAQEKLDE